MAHDFPIGPKTIFLTSNRPGRPTLPDLYSYAEADGVFRDLCGVLDVNEGESVHAVIVFEDLFMWATNILISRDFVSGGAFIQRAIRADWEFNAGVRPNWWPQNPEADRMWAVHYREDHHNGRAEVARMRLDRYDLRPLALTPLPPREGIPV